MQNDLYTCADLEVPLKVGGGRGGLNVLPCAKVSTIQLRAFEQYSIWEGGTKVYWYTVTRAHEDRVIVFGTQCSVCGNCLLIVHVLQYYCGNFVALINARRRWFLKHLRMELKKSSSFNNELTKARQKCYRMINRFYLILQSPQPVVKVSAFCQMFKHTIHSKKRKKKQTFTSVWWSQ